MITLTSAGGDYVIEEGADRHAPGAGDAPGSCPRSRRFTSSTSPEWSATSSPATTPRRAGISAPIATTRPRGRRIGASPSRSISTTISTAAKCPSPEFGPRGFKAPAGGAVIFSCSLLHQVSRVQRGKRYAFLPFLYDDAAAELRARNLQFFRLPRPARIFNRAILSVGLRAASRACERAVGRCPCRRHEFSGSLCREPVICACVARARRSAGQDDRRLTYSSPQPHGMHPLLAEALRRKGYDTLTAVQAAVADPKLRDRESARLVEDGFGQDRRLWARNGLGSLTEALPDAAPEAGGGGPALPPASKPLGLVIARRRASWRCRCSASFAGSMGRRRDHHLLRGRDGPARRAQAPRARRAYRRRHARQAGRSPLARGASARRAEGGGAG